MSTAQLVAPAAYASPADTAFRRAQWRMLLAAMFCYLFFYTGRQTFGFAIPGIQAEFGVSKETLGWVSAIMLWCYAIGQAINGNLGDKFGGRRGMSAGAILSCIMNWATSFATGVVSLGVFWGINGYVQAMGWAPGSRLLSNWWGRHERGKVYGFYVFAAGLASVMSFVTSLIIVQYLHLDWRWIFRIPVLLLLVGGVTFYLVARERPEDLGFDSPHDDAVDEKAAARVADDETSWQRYKGVLGNWRLIVGGLAIGFQNAARYGLLIWVPVHFLGTNWKAAGDAALIDPKWISVALPVGMAFGAATNGAGCPTSCSTPSAISPSCSTWRWPRSPRSTCTRSRPARCTSGSSSSSCAASSSTARNPRSGRCARTSWATSGPARRRA